MVTVPRISIMYQGLILRRKGPDQRVQTDTEWSTEQLWSTEHLYFNEVFQYSKIFSWNMEKALSNIQVNDSPSVIRIS